MEQLIFCKNKSTIMKQISIWAKNHVWQSRLIIILLYVILNVVGINTGKLFKDLDIVIPKMYLTACIAFTIFLWAFYPSKKNDGSSGIFPSSYSYRKAFDFLLVAVTFLMIVYAGSNLKYFIFKNDTAMAFNIKPFSKEPLLYQNPLVTNFITTIRKMDVSKLTQREKIRIIKNQIKTIKRDKATSKSDKTLSIILL